MTTQWSRTEIRQARQTPLKPVLERLGYRLKPTGQQNYMVLGLPTEVVVKDHYWVRLDDGSAGNAIDFMVQIQRMSFNQAMETLRGAESPRPS